MKHIALISLLLTAVLFAAGCNRTDAADLTIDGSGAEAQDPPADDVEPTTAAGAPTDPETETEAEAAANVSAQATGNPETNAVSAAEPAEVPDDASAESGTSAPPTSDTPPTTTAAAPTTTTTTHAPDSSGANDHSGTSEALDAADDALAAAQALLDSLRGDADANAQASAD